MDLLSDLNEAQRKAVTHTGSPLLIVAGAGTGKTTVVTRRFAWLVAQNLAAQDHILTLTFTEKAASEMEERIDQLVPLSSGERWVMTFHAFCERVLRVHALDVGLPGDFKILDTTGQWLLMRRNLDKFSLDYYKPLGNPSKFINVLLDHFSRAKDEGITPEAYMVYVQAQQLNTDSADLTEVSEVARYAEIAHAYHLYQQIKLDQGLFDFGDLMLYTCELFQKRPAVLTAWRNQFPYIMVDEFQDTNFVQYQVMKLLGHPSNNITVVGDDEQSIYAFRGASMSNILHFKDEHPTATSVVLTENYRSLQGILDKAYSFIQANNPNRLEYTLKIPKKLKATREGSAVIKHLHASSLAEETQLIADTILKLRRSDPTLAFRDIAVLARANSHIEGLLPTLDRAEIPYQFLASSGLYAKPVILDVVAYLKLLDNYHESAALYRVLTMPFLGMPYEDIALLTHYAKRKGISLYAALKASTLSGISEKANKIIDTILHRIATHSVMAHEGHVGKLIFAFLEEFEYLTYLAGRAQLGNIVAIASLSALQQFLKKIEEFMVNEPHHTLHHVMETLDLLLQAGDEGSMSPLAAEQGPDTVQLMTVHGAKGLEFRYVFIINMVDLRFPSVERKEPLPLPEPLVKELLPPGDLHIEEERRLLYVALTRARDGVFVTSADDYGGLRKKKLSRFLIEMGFAKPEVVEPTGQVIFRDQNPHATRDLAQRDNDQNLKPITYNLPSSFSFTQLKAFQACPLQYKFAHILMVPVKGKASFSFGKSVHAALEKFLKERIEATKMKQSSLFGEYPSPQPSPARGEGVVRLSLDGRGPAAGGGEGELPSLKHLLDLYEQSWIGDWYESETQQADYKDKGKKMLTTWYEGLKGAWPKVAMCEAPFKITVGPYTMKGVIDRIDKVGSPVGDVATSDNEVAIIDYKTGKTPDEDKIDKDQLLLYHMAATEVWGLTPVSLHYWYLEDATPITFTATEKDIARLKEKIVTTLDAIKTSDFKATPSTYTCRSCDFNSICEYRML